MANIEKYTMSGALAIIRHCERTAATHSNENIDMARTVNNFSLWPPGRPDRMIFGQGVEGQSSAKYAYGRLKKRLSEVSCLNRKDVNVMCDWCIHLGVDTPPGYADQREFFEACVRYIARTYGAENIIFAWVHRDEGAPHIHIGFVPVIKKRLKLRKNASEASRRDYEKAVQEGKNWVDRVDADSLINLAHLKNWHSNFSRYMTEELGYDPGVHTGITQALGGDLTVQQLKRKSPRWAEKRRMQTEAFHEKRKAEKEGRKASLAAQIALTSPPIQSSKVDTGGKKPSLSDLISGAKSRSGPRKR